MGFGGGVNRWPGAVCPTRHLPSLGGPGHIWKQLRPSSSLPAYGKGTYPYRQSLPAVLKDSSYHQIKVKFKVSSRYHMHRNVTLNFINVADGPTAMECTISMSNVLRGNKYFALCSGKGGKL
jgi:hypothetical protein